MTRRRTDAEKSSVIQAFGRWIERQQAWLADEQKSAAADVKKLARTRDSGLLFKWSDALREGARDTEALRAVLVALRDANDLTIAGLLGYYERLREEHDKLVDQWGGW
jgi:hypothetical protein